jgi:hypothetical protein
MLCVNITPLEVALHLFIYRFPQHFSRRSLDLRRVALIKSQTILTTDSEREMHRNQLYS